MLIQNRYLRVESITKQDFIFSFDKRNEEDDILRTRVVPK